MQEKKQNCEEGLFFTGPAQIYPNLYTGVPLPPYQYPHGHYPQGVSPLNQALFYPGHTSQYGGADQMEQHGEDDIIIATVPSTVSVLIIINSSFQMFIIG